MRKLTYLAIVAMAIGMVACTGGKKPGYVITGTVEGAANGDTVFLQELANRQFNKLDTAIIENGTFTFEGVQDSTVNRYLTCKVGEQSLMMDFFLENGTIKAQLSKNSDSATGTANNDAYQEIRSQIDVLNQKANLIYEALRDSTLTEEQKKAKMQEYSTLEEEMNKVNTSGITKNITNPVGVSLFKQNYYSMSTAENEALLQQIPANFQNDEVILKIKEVTERQKKTAVGEKFIDFAMLTPDGKPVELSDYVGKGKVVLIDFWASWCGPCRRDMPNLVDVYAKYKGKNFEIVGVSLDKDGEAWKESIKSLHITWPQMSDLKFWNSEGAQLYAVNSIPHTVLVDGEGTIIARGLHGEELQKKLSEVIK